MFYGSDFLVSPRPLIARDVQHNGLFISFEGQDGSGKTTLIDKIYDILMQEGHAVHRVEEFSRSHFGKHLIQTLRNDKFLRVHGKYRTSLTQFLAILNDCIYLTEHEIVPHLENGEIVLKDRHIDSVVACQLPILADEYRIPEKDLLRWFENVVRIIPVMPDFTFYIDASLKTRIRRIRARDRQFVENRAKSVSREDIAVFSNRDRIFALIAAKNKNRIIVYDNDKKGSEAAAIEIASIISREWQARSAKCV
jgi:dTMP kinase